MKKIIAFTLFIAFVCSFVPTLAGGAWIAVIPDSEEIARGEPVNTAIRLGWWEASPGFAVLRISYDSKLLTIEKVDTLDENVTSVNTEKGLLTLVYCSPDGQPADGESDLVRIAFKSVKTGKCIVTPTIVSITDSRWTEISSENSSTVISIR